MNCEVKKLWDIKILKSDIQDILLVDALQSVRKAFNVFSHS